MECVMDAPWITDYDGYFNRYYQCTDEDYDDEEEQE